MAGAGARLQNWTARNSEIAPVLEGSTGQQVRLARLPRRSPFGRSAPDGRAERPHPRMGRTTEDAGIAVITAEHEIGRATKLIASHFRTRGIALGSENFPP